MVFNYAKYCEANLVRPLLAILAGAAGLGCFTVPQIVALVQNPLEYSYLVQPIFGAGAILLFWMISIGHPFWAGGYHLLWEKPKDLVCITGKIEAIRECSSFQCFHYDTAYGPSQGYRITVHGTAYLAMDFARCLVGDDVVITVLPRSRIVLSIMKVEENDHES